MMNTDHPAIVLVSGGMDSCVTAAIAAREHAELAFLHANYGQRTEARELRAFREIAQHFGATRTHVVSMAHLAAIGGSSLTDPSIPVTHADLTATGVPTSYVPFRNANILAVAVSWAEVLGARSIYIGAVEEDSSGYPDCRGSFFDAYNAMITQGTKPGSGIVIRTPLLHMSKAQIVKRGTELGAPLVLTWSCYQGQEEACGLCDSCALRLRGFQQAGIPDPIPYKVRPDYSH
jgi:7-cyano-7-deazaguanine synthase